MTTSVIRINGYEVGVSHGYDLNQLQKHWLSVQRNKDVPYFLTWDWISCWIGTYDPSIVFVTAKFKDEIIAIGLFTCSVENRHGFIKSNQYRLYQMGDKLRDQIWMEYNDFIAVDEHRVDGVNACIKALQQVDRNWDEIIISMMTRSRAKQLMDNNSQTNILLTNSCYAVNLDTVRKNNLDYLSSLTRNTRYQIQRSIRLYQEFHGDLKLTIAHSSDQALEFFHEAGKLHVLRWSDSGYNNEQFIQFHQNLIIENYSQKNIDLMKVSAGDVTVGILYFQKVNKNVYFYLHGLNYESDNKLKPGLVGHALATQYYIDQGMQVYDYMGGYSQYKCQLASRTEDMITICIQRPRVMFTIEKIGRGIRRFFRNPSGRKI